jgi:hypothetical protein
LLLPILETHSPVDLLIIFMGTNDVLHHGDMTASDAARGVEVLVRMALASETRSRGTGARGVDYLAATDSHALTGACRTVPWRSGAVRRLFPVLPGDG